jgi:hypothetical protein
MEVLVPLSEFELGDPQRTRRTRRRKAGGARGRLGLLVTEWAIFQFWLLDQTARFAGCLGLRWNLACRSFESPSRGKVLSVLAVLSYPLRCDITRRGGWLMGIWAAGRRHRSFSVYTHVCIPDGRGEFKVRNWASLRIFGAGQGERGENDGRVRGFSCRRFARSAVGSRGLLDKGVLNSHEDNDNSGLCRPNLGCPRGGQSANNLELLPSASG